MTAHRLSLVIACAVLGGCGARKVAAPAKCETFAKVLPYDLPQAETWASVRPILQIGIDGEGHVSVDGHSVQDDSALLAALASFAGDHGTTRIVIDADKRVPFQSVIRVMDLLVQSRFSHIGFGVAPPPGSAAIAASRPTNEPTVAKVEMAWDCPFPPEADRAKVDSAVVVIQATISESGAAEDVTVLSDPGNGFGEAARSCATKQYYKPGIDAEGRPLRTTTKPFRVRFER
ncbi:MAG TPA: biopolymer transporter ExbD [Labilithrix sp.]|nr:biopolymer transporter ExbD [Labilithrix sp.]